MIDRAKESEAFEIAGNLGVGPKQIVKFDKFSNRVSYNLMDRVVG